MTSYFNDPRQIKAPWTPQMITALQRYQEEGRFHPYTCCDHRTMTVTETGLHCATCGNIQNWVLESTLQLMGVYE